MIAALLAAVQLSVPAPRPALQDSIPQVTLAEALRMATDLDPNYVAALGQIANAEWGRRAAIAAFVIPSITLQGTYQKSSTPSFNVGTGAESRTFTVAQATASYELFAGGRRFADLAGTAASLTGAKAGEVQARYASALVTESAFYQVLSLKELVRVRRERLGRAEQQLAVARSRVIAGAAVQTDSLQLSLERTRAQVDLLIEESRLRVARYDLGSLIGQRGQVDAAPLNGARAPDLPMTLQEAVAEALDRGPSYRIARADEKAASAAFTARKTDYLPQVGLTATTSAFDERIFPDQTKRSTISIGVTLPIWDGGQREIALTQARVNRDVARAVREDLERSAWRDVTRAYEAYITSRAAEDLARGGLTVAQENYRVQAARYQEGATTILDLLEAQVSLTDAESGIVQARQATQLALAGLEAILGRRLFPGKE